MAKRQHAKRGLSANLKQLQIIALWISFLVISLPLVQAVNTVTISSISGTDGINGLRRQDDIVKVDAHVVVDDGDTADLAQNLFLTEQGAPGGIVFDSCSVSNGGFDCHIESEPFRKTRKTVYLVDLFPGMSQAAGTSASLDVDNAAPIISNVHSDKTAVSGGMVNIGYTVQDKTCSGCSRCVGIKNVDLYANGTKSSSQEIQTLRCEQVSDTATIDTTPLPDGRITLCLLPIDQFDQVSSVYVMNGRVTSGNNCVSLLKDSTMPASQSVRLVYANTEQPVDYLSDEGTEVTLFATVTTGQFGLNKVTFDLGALGYTGVFADCAAVTPTEHHCQKTFTAMIAADTTAPIAIIVEDNGGNRETMNYSLSLKLDSDAPIVNFVGTMAQLGNASVLGKNDNVLKAILTEEGSGVDNNNVYFVIEGSRLRANCTGTTCIYEGYQHTGEGSQALIQVEGTDDVGHVFSGQAAVAVDTAAPELLNYTLQNNRNAPYFQQGDTIVFSATVTDFSGLDPTASSANLASFSNNTNTNPTCTALGDSVPGQINIFNCVWNIFDAAPSAQLTMGLTLADIVGNTADIILDQFAVVTVNASGSEVILPPQHYSIAGVTNESANFWELVIGDPAPAFVDEDTTQVTKYRVFWPAELIPRGTGVQLVDMQFNPSMCNGNATRYLEDIELIQTNFANFTPFFLKMTFQKTAIEETNLTFSCKVITKSIFANTVYPAEEDNQSMNISVVNVGEISQGVRDTIESVRSSWLVEAEWIGTINKFIQFAKTLCQFLEAFINLIGILAVLSGATEVLDDLGITYPIGLGVRMGEESVHAGGHGLQGVINKFCKFLSCRTGWAGTINAWRGNTIQSSLPTTDPKILEAAAWPSDPSQSLVLSVVSLCIPGVFYNLQKARSVECSYLDCMRNNVAAGTPPFACDRLRNYGWCRYVWGEIFQVIPFANFIQDISGTISRMLSNPVSLILGIASYGCTPSVVKGGWHFFCLGASYATQIGDITQDIDTIVNTNWDLAEDNCEDILEQLDEEEEIPQGSNVSVVNP